MTLHNACFKLKNFKFGEFNNLEDLEIIKKNIYFFNDANYFDPICYENMKCPNLKIFTFDIRDDYGLRLSIKLIDILEKFERFKIP